jgi:four helix bundle protein
MQDFRKLLVWTKAHELALGIHRLTQDWPRSDTAGLVGQMRRAAMSIPANIAEGCGRNGDKDFAKFLQIAIGSSVELEYHLLFAGDAAIMPTAESRLQQERVVEVRRMLVGLIRKVRKDPPSNPSQH